MPGLKSEKLLSGYKTKAVGAYATSVCCNGKWVTVGMVVDAMKGVGLSIDELAGEDAEPLQAWLELIFDDVDAVVVVSDDADAFKKVNDKTGRSQKVCKIHMRNLFIEPLITLAGNHLSHGLRLADLLT